MYGYLLVYMYVNMYICICLHMHSRQQMSLICVTRLAIYSKCWISTTVLRKKPRIGQGESIYRSEALQVGSGRRHQKDLPICGPAECAQRLNLT